MANHFRDKLESLSSNQLGAIEIILGLIDLQCLKQLEKDLRSISGIDYEKELKSLIVTELYNYFTGEQIESPVPEPVQEIDYMEAIKSACGR